MRFINFKVVSFSEIRDQDNLREILNNADKRLEEINLFQKKILHVIGKSKAKLSEPGIYKLLLVLDTLNYVNYWKYKDENPYYLFNAIDNEVLLSIKKIQL